MRVPRFVPAQTYKPEPVTKKGVTPRRPTAPVQQATAPAPVVQAPPPVAQIDSDHELLLEVERAIQSDTPRALEPATLMVEETDGDMPLDPALKNKETRSHEN